MFKSYFKMAWRSLMKNKVSSIINIGGLSIGLATGIVIMLVIVDELSYDKFNKNLGDIYLLMKNDTTGGTIITGRTTPGPLAASVSNNIPEIKYTVRTSQGGQEMLQNGDKSIYLESVYTEPDFFNMMTLPAVKGNPFTALKEPGSIILTASAAHKLFGNEDPVGKMLIHNNLNAVKVAAVVRDVPQNSSVSFDFVLSWRLYEQENPEWINNWDNNRILTWIQAKPNIAKATLNNKLKNLLLISGEQQHTELFAYPLRQLNLYSHFKNGKPSGGIIDIVLLLSLIGLFVLLIACINFMNLATARSERRAREVGVRKVMGASRRLIIFQFLTEAVLMSLLALIIGLFLAKLALPAFMEVSGKHFKPDFTNWMVWTLLIALGIVTGLLAGSYPAFYLSHFQPVKVLKKLMTRDKGGSLLRKSLVTFQFMISIFLIIATISIFKQINHLQRRPIGYAPENLVDIPARGDMADKFDLVKNELREIPGVKEISAGNDNLTGFGGAFNGLEWPGKTPDQDFFITSTGVQYNWVKTTGVQLAEGRDFSPEYGADTLSCLINMAAVKRMKLKEPVVGTRLGNNTVIGVIRDFVFNNPTGPTAPMIIFLSKGSMSHFLVRIENNDKWKATIAQVEKVVKKINPNFPFEFRFIKEEYQKGFRQIKSVAFMANAFGIMAIFISCLGLFGLSAFLAERRSKEVSIRKVLGASVSSLWFSLSKDFLKPVFIAFILAAPIAGWIMEQLIYKMEYHVQLSWWIYVIAGVVAVSIAVLTVSVNGIKAALAKPIGNLGTE